MGNYVLKGDSASPIDMADRLSYALYGMTTGVYTLGEAVFEDSVWETSYEETFANTKSTPELWLSSALGTDMTGILYGTVTAARGYSYRFSEWEEIDLTVSNFDWLFRSASGEDWNGTSAAKLRREMLTLGAVRKRPMTTMQQPRYRRSRVRMSLQRWTSGCYYSRRTAAFTS